MMQLTPMARYYRDDLIDKYSRAGRPREQIPFGLELIGAIYSGADSGIARNVVHPLTTFSKPV